MNRSSSIMPLFVRNLDCSIVRCLLPPSLLPQSKSFLQAHFCSVKPSLRSQCVFLSSPSLLKAFHYFHLRILYTYFCQNNYCVIRHFSVSGTERSLHFV